MKNNIKITIIDETDLDLLERGARKMTNENEAAYRISSKSIEREWV